jgi:predicted MFS family arabinose efflux permease
MQFFFSPVLGQTSDTRGRKPILIFSILTSIGSFVLFTCATNYLRLLSSQVIARKLKQKRVPGLTQSVGRIARIPGSVLSGLMTELTGLSTSFFFGGLILIIPFLVGCRMFSLYALEGLLKRR